MRQHNSSSAQGIRLHRGISPKQNELTVPQEHRKDLVDKTLVHKVLMQYANSDAQTLGFEHPLAQRWHVYTSLAAIIGLLSILMRSLTVKKGCPIYPLHVHVYGAPPVRETWIRTALSVHGPSAPADCRCRMSSKGDAVSFLEGGSILPALMLESRDTAVSGLSFLRHLVQYPLAYRLLPMLVLSAATEPLSACWKTTLWEQRRLIELDLRPFSFPMVSTRTLCDNAWHTHAKTFRTALTSFDPATLSSIWTSHHMIAERLTKPLTLRHTNLTANKLGALLATNEIVNALFGGGCDTATLCAILRTADDYRYTPALAMAQDAYKTLVDFVHAKHRATGFPKPIWIREKERIWAIDAVTLEVFGLSRLLQRLGFAQSHEIISVWIEQGILDGDARVKARKRIAPDGRQHHIARIRIPKNTLFGR